jgi:hypothetical protein
MKAYLYVSCTGAKHSRGVTNLRRAGSFASFSRGLLVCVATQGTSPPRLKPCPDEGTFRGSSTHSMAVQFVRGGYLGAAKLICSTANEFRTSWS